jgi:hypothetical protein
VGHEVRRLEAQGEAAPTPAILGHLVHEDGLLRVPVLLWGEMLVRGFTEELYDEALGAYGRPAEGPAREER